jgi:hypothetical protein
MKYFTGIPVVHKRSIGVRFPVAPKKEARMPLNQISVHEFHSCGKYFHPKNETKIKKKGTVTARLKEITIVRLRKTANNCML